MRITCPACSAAYEVPDHLLGAPRTLRCARCNHEWTVGPATSPASPPTTDRPGAPPPAPTDSQPADSRPTTSGAPPVDPAKPDPEAWGVLRKPLGAAPSPLLPPDRADDPVLTAQPHVRPRRRAGIGVWLGWIVSLAVLIVLGWSACTYRLQISQAWPPSQRVYQALGLADAPATTSQK